MATKKTAGKKNSSLPARSTSKGKGVKKVEKVMHEFKHGELKSGKGGKGGKVKSREQAIAIGLSEARKAGSHIPKKAAGKKLAQ